MAPEGKENLFLLVPFAAGLDDTPESRQSFAERILRDFLQQIGAPIRDHMVEYRDFAHRDFDSRYDAYKGTALGLARTMRRTAIYWPRMKSGKVDGL